MKNVLLAKGKRLLLLALGAGSLGAAGCGGQVSFFEVSVGLTGISQACAYAIASCDVTVSGAANDSFQLSDQVCNGRMSLQRGKFQYGTEAESGNVKFHVDVFNGNRKKLGAGEAEKAIVPGGRATLDLTVMADAAALAETMACGQAAP